MTTQRHPDPNADEFVCDECGKIDDIENSHKPEGKKGKLICTACYIKQTILENSAGQKNVDFISQN